MNAQAAWLLSATDPNDADGVYKAAVTALKSGLEAQVLPLARAAVARHPNDARMWQVLALAYRRSEDLAPAVEAIARAATLAPLDPLIAHTQARASLEAGLPALALFERAARLAPNDETVLLGRIAAQFAEGRVDDAIRDLDERLERQPLWLAGHGSVSRLRWMRGERESFTASFSRAIAKLPRELALRRELVDTLMHAALYDRALQEIAAARAALGDNPVLDALQAVAVAESGDVEAADRLFAALGPIQHITMAVRYVRHLLRAGRAAQAAAVAAEWTSRDPDRLMTPYLTLAWRLTGDPRWEWLEGDERFIGVYDLADDLPPLEALADRLRGFHLALHQPLEQSVRGGTQTDGPLFSRIEPEIRALRTAVVRAVERHAAQLPPPRAGHPLLIAKRTPIRFAGSWSIRLSGAGFHVNHVHPAGWLSSALYVALPEAAMGGSEHAGWLSLGEATEIGVDLPPIRLVEPKPGRLVLFPSTMWHGTRPYSEGERLTVAFDVARPPQ